MECDKCKTEMVVITKKSKVTLLGVIGTHLFVIGLAVAFANLEYGLILMIVGIFPVIVFRGKKQVMICPSCK